MISAGVIMNMLFAFAVYTGINAVWGLQEAPDTRVGRVRADLLPTGAEALADLPAGSRLIAIGGRQVDDWLDVQNAIMQASSGPLTIATEDPVGEFEIDVDPDLEVRAQIFGGLSFWTDAEVGSVSPGTTGATFTPTGIPAFASTRIAPSLRSGIEARGSMTLWMSRLRDVMESTTATASCSASSASKSTSRETR